MATRQTQRDITSILRTSQQKALSTGVLTVVLIAVLVLGSLRPTLSTIFETNQKYEEKQQLLSTLKTQNQKLTQLVALKQDAKDTVDSINTYFPYDGDFSLFIVNLNQIANTYKLTMGNVSFSETLNNQIKENEAFVYKGMTPTTFQVTLSGDRTNLYSFLSYLESAPFFPKIISVQFGASTTQNTLISIAFVVYKLESQLK